MGKSKLDKNEKIMRMRHSLSHVMCEAVLEMFPDAQVAIGPAIDTGFYYDFELPRKLKEEDLVEIENRMKNIIKQDKTFEKIVVDRSEAKKIFKDQKYKLELIDSIDENEEVSIYKQGIFQDLCRGPHVNSTKQLQSAAFKLMNIAGAYWRGDEKNTMLTRIYATAWSNPKDLRLYLQHLEDVEKRDHRKIGKEQNLFSLHEEAGAGLVYWHPRGAAIRSTIEEFWKKEHAKGGYDIVYTPHVGKSWLWETSGHLNFYKEGMYPSMVMDNANYYTKPMNCPFHIMIYNTGKHSYRDLPFRWCELGTVYRYEKAGALHGLLRVRGFTQDDAHIFCTPEQMDSEIDEVLRFSIKILKDFGFNDFHAYVSTMPEKSVGDPERWKAATSALKASVERMNIKYDIDEGGGAFYGPKIDIKIKDAIGREWQLSTIQFDFNLPERFKMVYVDKDGKEKRPYMIHRALLGSIERFFGVLTEHFAGSFPPWLAPEQVCVIPVSEKFDSYSKEVEKKLRVDGFRVKADYSSDRLSAKIRNAQNAKIPFMLVLGEKEVENNTVSLRSRKGKQQFGLSYADLVEKMNKIIDNKEQV